jgi:hypothetical protein
MRFRAMKALSALTCSSVALMASLLFPGGVSALAYDGTNPGATTCGNGSHPVYVLATAYINYNGSTIGRVELRQSAYCATVWSRVFNYTTGSVQAHETITIYSDPNGSSPVSYTSTDTLSGSGGSTSSGWSNQYRDRPSFKASGEIYYAGAWRSATTNRAPAWTQDHASIPGEPYSCNNTTNHYCWRWPTAANGTSVFLKYWLNPYLGILPNGSGTYDARSDARYMFAQWESLDASNPFIDEASYNEDYDVLVATYTDDPSIYARTWVFGYQTSPRYYYYSELKLNWNVNWSDARGVFCHEIGHVEGLQHVYEGSVQGSKATCMGMGYTSGPYIDDESGLHTIYSQALP